jgi:hypothetical protein
MSIRNISSGSTEGRPISLQFLMMIGQRDRDKQVHAPQQVVVRDAILKPELV